ncbi:uncharacterized protein LOC131207139 [Anopheles bellator]|uniref:uncharacterized protein LOC131207139 n=1 Tax=Anopheles bellator TaxID=139047 RepID=UPI002649875E|nr:uncharacterized protein LOC131207139 [Anopheles bellator]
MDPLEQSRAFLDCFRANVNPADPLPVRVPIYNLKHDEIEPAIVDWTRTYLDQFECPHCLLTPIIRNVLEAVLKRCEENPESCGYTGRDYKTLQLNHEVISRVNQICSELLDNERLNNLLAQLRSGWPLDEPDSGMHGAASSQLHNPVRQCYVARGLKNRRRTMEDRHVCLPDFDKLFQTRDIEPTAFYGVYDGHGGQDAASFAASHLHYYIAQSEHYPHNMTLAFEEGFHKTDRLFGEKCANHHLNSGSTAVVCFHHITSKRIDVAWVGDSQAIMVKRSPNRELYQRLVYPTHSASNPEERDRIHAIGGNVIFWYGGFRVNGQLAITRAIGNPAHKPFVSADPGICLNTCTDDDLFLVIASDGLWEACDEQFISMFVLYAMRKFPNDPQKINDYLIAWAKQETTDNITVIIVFLKDIQTIIKETPFVEELEIKAKHRANQKMDLNDATSHGLLAENTSIPLEDHKAIEDIQNFMLESAMVAPKSLCAGPVDDMGFLSGGGLGPETDVDGLHDSQQSPSPMLLEDEEKKTGHALGNGDVATHHEMGGHGGGVEHDTDYDYNPFGMPSNDETVESPSAPETTGDANSHDIEEDPTSPSSVSADPADFSEEHPVPHVNGTGVHHNPLEEEEAHAEGAFEKLADSEPVQKAELNEDIHPRHIHIQDKSLDEPMDLLGADSIVDNKLIDQLDSFGISEAIRRQLIEQQVTGAPVHHEQEEDEDDGQLIEEKHSEFDGAEKEDLHHEKAFDSDYGNDHHSAADVKQDDDAGCCEDSEEDEWDYVKVNQQTQEQQKQESTPSDPVENSVTTPEDHQQPSGEQERRDDERPLDLALEDDLPQKEEEHQQKQQEPHAFDEHQQEQEKPEVEPEQHSEVQQGDDEPTETEIVDHKPVEVLGENAVAESAVPQSASEFDDVISGSTEVVNLLNELNKKATTPTAIVESPSDINEAVQEEEPFESGPSDSFSAQTMEANPFGDDAAAHGHALSFESPLLPVQDNRLQEEQQHHQEKDLFSMSAVEKEASEGGPFKEELNEKHLYEAEEKSMHHAAGGDMGWQLNPEAKEFVPILPGSGTGPSGETPADFTPSRMLDHESYRLRDDTIVAQSPRKGTASSMEDLDVPQETDFQTEMDKRPHEFELVGESSPLSPLAKQPVFDLQSAVLNGDEHNGDDHNGDDRPKSAGEGSLPLMGTDCGQLGGTVPADDLDFLNKVHELPEGEEDAQLEAFAVNRQFAEPPAVAYEEQVNLMAASEPYSAKEEQHIEHKETIDEPSPAADFVQDFGQLSLNNGHTDPMTFGANPFLGEEIPMTVGAPLAAGNASPFFDLSSTNDQNQPTISEVAAKQFVEDVQTAPLTAFEPSLLPAQEFTPIADAATQGSTEPTPEPVIAAEPKLGEEPSDDLMAKDASGTTAPVAAVAVAAAGAVAVAASAASKTAKPKAPASSTTAKKTGPSSATAKPAVGASKDTTKSAATARTTASNTTSTAAAATRKPPAGAASAAKKTTPTTGGKTSVASATTATMNGGVKEARPSSAASTKTSTLAAKKPSTDAATKPTATKASTVSSVAAARAKAAAPSSTTMKTATTGATATRTVPKSTTTAASGVAGKPTASSRLSTTTTRPASRPVSATSRPSSTVSEKSSTTVPSKTTTTVKRTVAAKSTVTNGTTTVDGTTKTTKSTTTTSTTARAPATTAPSRATATSRTSTIGTKKPLDTKPSGGAATTKSTSASLTTSSKSSAISTRTSLAPRPTATSPAVKKLQNGTGPAKKTAASPTPVPIKKPASPAASKQQAVATTTVTNDNMSQAAGGGADVVDTETVEMVAPQPDQLLVPQAM